MSAEPQVNPPPKASIKMRWPGFILPLIMPSSKARGIEAAEVLPWNFTVDITFSEFIFILSATALSILWFAWWGTNQSIWFIFLLESWSASSKERQSLSTAC